MKYSTVDLDEDRDELYIKCCWFLIITFIRVIWTCSCVGISIKFLTW